MICLQIVSYNHVLKAYFDRLKFCLGNLEMSQNYMVWIDSVPDSANHRAGICYIIDAGHVIL